MPLYDYKCKEHGLFHELTTMADHEKPKPCPHCGTLCSRVIVIPPEVLLMSPEKRKAKQLNEEAQHQPKTVEEHRETQARVQALRKSCGCHSHSHGSKDKDGVAPAELHQQVVYMADGSKVFPSQRPWMISH